jgi:methyl-accepting chemotaxis protein
MQRISQIDSYLQGSFIFNISSFLIMLAVALLAGYFTSNIFITQIDEINQIAKKLSEGDLSIKIESQNQNEFDTLKSSLNKTKENLCSVVSSIQTTLKELNQKALRLDSIAKRFSDTAQKQAASSEETSATIEELSSSFDSVVQTIQTSNKSLKVVDSKSQNLNESLALAGRGLKDVAKRSSETSSAAEAGRSNIESTNESMKKILDTSQKISNLVGIITEISDQTNLLALNAAIEAARAGDAGRGFAVVATEVAKLAERTATNVKDIKALIHSVNQAIKEGVTNVENSSSFFEKIIESIQRITEESTKVIDSIQKQFSTMEEIAREINQISTMYTEMESAIVEQKEATYQMNTVSQELTSDAQELSASAQEIDSSSSEIKQLSQALAKKVQFFKLNN